MLGERQHSDVPDTSFRWWGSVTLPDLDEAAAQKARAAHLWKQVLQMVSESSAREGGRGGGAANQPGKSVGPKGTYGDLDLPGTECLESQYLFMLKTTAS